MQSPFNETDPRLSPDGRWLAYASDESGAQEVYTRLDNTRLDYDVAPDGQRFMVNQLVGGATVNVITNWHASVQR